jgi:hypothetical protein
MTYQILERYSSTMERRSGRESDRLISSVHSIQILINLEVLISLKIYTYVLPVESKETVYKSLHNKRG